jgi:hypothetical protein
MQEFPESINNEYKLWLKRGDSQVDLENEQFLNVKKCFE